MAMERKPRLSRGPRDAEEWRKKVHPFFIGMMEQYKQFEQLSRSSSEADREKAQQWARNPPEYWHKQAREVGEQFRKNGVVQRNIVGKILDLDLQDESEIKQPSDEQFMLSWLSWYKYGKTWHQLQYERGGGDWKASKQILAVLTDYEKWKFGKLDPNDMRFKIDRPHFNLMAFGLDFGLDKLTGDALVDCLRSVLAKRSTTLRTSES